MAPKKSFRPFGRRKSSANILDEIQNVPATESSFKVLERPSHQREKSFDGGIKLAQVYRPTRPDHIPLTLESDNIFEDLKSHRFRGSAVSNSNTASTADNSSRFSAASTAPSSIDNNHYDSRSANEKTIDTTSPPPPSKSPFSLKAAGRSFSFGIGKESRKSGQSPGAEEPTVSLGDNPSVLRHRAQTTTSLANAPASQKLEEREQPSSDRDFYDMFSSFGKRKSRMPAEYMSQPAMKSPSPDLSMSGPTIPTIPAPPNRTYNGRTPQPSPLDLDHTTQVEEPPYSWTSRDSSDRLMHNASPVIREARNNQSPPPPPVPRHADVPSTRVQRPEASASNIRRNSALLLRRQSTLEYNTDVVDEDAELLRNSMVLSQMMNESSEAEDWDQVSKPDVKTPDAETSFRGSLESTPRPRKASPLGHDENIFETNGLTTRAVEKQPQRAPSPVKNSGENKVMTPAQFEKYKKDQEARKRIDDERIKSFGGKPLKDDDEDAYEEDDEDEEQKKKELAKARRKQEAHMAVYRQQMMKVTGEAPSMPHLFRPGMTSSHSAPNIIMTHDDEDEDDEVPLGILAAHGFPNKNRQPGQLGGMGSNSNLRGAAQPSGALPVFARNLPQDPYVGASLVNSSNREPLSYGGTGSVVGSMSGGPRQPTGLVNVIVKEERERAMRRGNPAGEHGLPLPPNTMGNMLPHGMQMPPGQLTPGDQAQLMMTQQMQQFMSMQMQFMTMIAAPPPSQAGQPQHPAHSQPQFLGDHQRSSTMGNLAPPGPPMRPGSAASQQRAMTSLDPNSAPWTLHQGHRASTFMPPMHMPGDTYSPSIAPSERSNIGQPGRYRPVTTALASDTSRRNSTAGILTENWAVNQQPMNTIKMVKKSAEEDDEDEEAGWEKMKLLREKKKSQWRSKKDVGVSIGF